MQLCDIMNIRTITEQPVNSRFFRHPAVQVACMKTYVQFQDSMLTHDFPIKLHLSFEAAITRLRLHRTVIQLGAFAAPSP